MVAAAQQLPIQCPSVQPDPASGQPKGDGGCCKRHGKWFLVIAIVCFVLASIAAGVFVHWLDQDQDREPLYHVVVDAVTGLDPATDLARPVLDPEFNLTISLASRSVTTGWCLTSGSTVRLSYRRVELAKGPVPSFCVGRRRSGAQSSVFAWGNGVRAPRMFRDALASDLRRGVAELDVVLTVVQLEHVPGPEGMSREVSCKAKVAQPVVRRADMVPVSYYAHSPSPVSS